MNIKELKKLMREKGYRGNSLKGFHTIDFDYQAVCLDAPRKYVIHFGESYREKGVYVFSSKVTKEILYVGETHVQSIGKRLSAHFVDKNQGGLRYKYRNNPDIIGRIDSSQVTVLYSSQKSEKEIICLQDLLIGLFLPDLNSL